MKKCFTIFAVFFSLSVSAQSNITQGAVPVVSEDGYAHALVLVRDTACSADLAGNGIIVNGRFGSVFSVQFCREKLEQLKKLPYIAYVDAATYANAARTKNDIERSFTSVDKVQNGLQNQLPKNYSGKGVVVGIVDVGFQCNNPTFFTTDGSKTRIARYWQQNNKNGSPPAGFFYGTEYTDSTTILEANDMDGVHGTHVAGIAAGSGLTTPGLQYRGVAPNAELVFVSIKYSNDTLGGSALGDYLVANPCILDAYKYIFDYAKSVGKPAVINLSWGMHTGPHDGTSLFDKATEVLTAEKGRVLVGSNGNEGANPMHISHAFSGDTMSTIMIENDRRSRPDESVYADFWGSANSTISIQIGLADTLRNIVTSFPFVSSATDQEHTFFYSDDSVSFKVTVLCTAKNLLNNKPNITVWADHNNPYRYAIVARITSVASYLDGWNSGGVRRWTSGAFRSRTGSFNFAPEFKAGGFLSTMGENGGTSKAVISVGALAARSGYKNILGENVNDSAYVLPGAIAGFSSNGPTVDGRIKPNVSAPGYDVPSAINNRQFSPWMIGKTVQQTVFRGDTNYWMVMNGTSMASPHVCGIVALMLEANPDLTADEVRDILEKTATKDQFTGSMAGLQYGHGKVNALAAVKEVVRRLGTGESHVSRTFTIYPNPVRAQLSVPRAAPVEIFSIDGKLVFTAQGPSINTEGLCPGIYFVKIKSGDEILVARFVKQ